MKEFNQALQPQDVTISGHRMHFWIGGIGPHLLLLHSAWGDAEMGWSSVWDQLAQSFTVIAPDLPGFGHSSGLSRPSLPAMAHLLKQLLDELNVNRVMIVGNSFAAAVAIQFAHTYPQLTSRLVLVNGGYMPPLPGPVKKLIALPLVKQGSRLLIRRLSYSAHAFKSSFVDPAKLPQGFLDKIARNAPVYSRITFDAFMNMTGPLAKPAVPTLLLWGAQDRLTPMKHARLLQEWIPGAELVPIDGAGHMPQLERPEEFVAAIRRL